MNGWRDFTDYLNQNIIKREEYSSQEDFELIHQVVIKFQIPSDKMDELLLELKLLLISYQQRFDTIGNYYHTLPKMEKDEEEEESSDEESDSDSEENQFDSKASKKPTLKTWKELFPTREECLFGESSKTEPPSKEVFLLLEKIYQDWWRKENKVKELGRWAKNWEKTSKKLIKEWVGEQAQEFLRKKKLNTLAELKSWLADYESLSEKQQKELAKEAKDIKKQVGFLDQGMGTGKVEKGWFKSLDWKSIIISSVMGIILIITVWIIKRYFFKK